MHLINFHKIFHVYTCCQTSVRSHVWWSRMLGAKISKHAPSVQLFFFFKRNICVRVCVINTMIRVRGLCVQWFVRLSWQWSFISSFESVTGNWVINNHYIFVCNKLYSQIQVCGLQQNADIFQPDYKVL
jgi:hypothetical protein